MLSFIEQEFSDGYLDGYDANNPEPNDNRHEAYRHSFEVARQELNGTPIPAWISRAKAKRIEARHIASQYNNNGE